MTIFHEGMGGEGNDPGLASIFRLLLANAVGGLVAIHLRHKDVHEDDVV